MMKNYSRLKGTGVALVTPFTYKGDIDIAALQKLVNHVIDNRVDYLVVLGTTGESVTLNSIEKEEVYKCVVQTNNNRVPVVIGIGGNNTAEIIKQLSKTDLSAADAVLSVSPYYNKPSQKGIVEHFKRVADASPRPVILYNVPGRTGSNMVSETTLELSEHKNIGGIKEASGNIEQCMQIIKHRPRGFLVISGDDNLTLPLIACGADGVISVVANAYSGLFSDMVRACLSTDFEKANGIHYKLNKLIPMLFEEGSPSGIKHILKLMNLTTDTVRLPMVNISDVLKEKIGREMALVEAS